uniref:Uncharacterized protein n=1 Tax=Myoviridae sp. ctqMr7 TaxID=2823552 RepID=A0A8S5LI01_9CAUD|nr:MAG TPA: hypothetical protein [Myoviridae sp. ctqMr7]
MHLPPNKNSCIYQRLLYCIKYCCKSQQYLIYLFYGRKDS